MSVTWLLLQQQAATPRSRLEGIRRELERRSQDVESWSDLFVVLFVVTAVMLLAWAAWDLYRYYRRRQQRSPRRLFRQALAYLGLAPADRRLLRRVARQLRLAEPVCMLMTPAAFQQATQRWLTERAASWEAPRTRARLTSLARVLLPDQLPRQDDEPGRTR